jgi:hypothetical protein
MSRELFNKVSTPLWADETSTGKREVPSDFAWLGLFGFECDDRSSGSWLHFLPAARVFLDGPIVQTEGYAALV